MDTREAFLVDACATEPAGGTPAGVVPDGADLTDDQLRAVANELGAATAVSADDGLRVVDPNGARDYLPHVAIAALAHQHERGERDVGTHAVTTAAGQLAVEITGDGTVWIEQPSPSVRDAAVEADRLAAALGVDVAALRDVGADLPPSVLSAGVDALAVPVNFLEHLSGADPDPGALRTVVDAVDADAICAFTFDTLTADAACHARVFAPEGTPLGVRTTGLEAPAMPAVAGALVTHLLDRGTIEDETTGVEQGQFAGRPGYVSVETGDVLRVGGRTVTSLEGTVSVPPADDDGIIEA